MLKKIRRRHHAGYGWAHAGRPIIIRRGGKQYYGLFVGRAGLVGSESEAPVAFVWVDEEDYHSVTQVTHFP